MIIIRNIGVSYVDIMDYMDVMHVSVSASFWFSSDFKPVFYLLHPFLNILDGIGEIL